MQSTNQPLFIMDGFEITLERMMDLDENQVESITLLKDASATAMYGTLRSEWCCSYCDEKAGKRDVFG